MRSYSSSPPIISSSILHATLFEHRQSSGEQSSGYSSDASTRSSSPSPEPESGKKRRKSSKQQKLLRKWTRRTFIFPCLLLLFALLAMPVRYTYLYVPTPFSVNDPDFIRFWCNRIYRRDYNPCLTFGYLPGMTEQRFHEECSDLISSDLPVCSSVVLDHRRYLPGDLVFHNYFDSIDERGGEELPRHIEVVVSTVHGTADWPVVGRKSLLIPIQFPEQTEFWTHARRSRQYRRSRWYKMPLASRNVSDTQDCSAIDSYLNQSACKPEIIVYSTGCDRHLNEYARLIVSTGFDLAILGLHTDWKGFGRRLKSYANYLRTLPPGKIVILTDASDSMILPGCSITDVVREFRLHGAPILFMAEKACWPDKRLASMYPLPDPPTDFLYINGGGYMGYVWALLDVLDNLITGGFDDCYDDQRFWTKAFLKRAAYISTRERPYLDPRRRFVSLLNDSKETVDRGKPYVKLDYYQSVFQSLFDVYPEDFDYSTAAKNGRVTLKETGGKPCLLHQNGDKSNKGIYQLARRLKIEFHE